eukprot:1707687-Pyramimonas_sp.AAC.1
MLCPRRLERIAPPSHWRRALARAMRHLCAWGACCQPRHWRGAPPPGPWTPSAAASAAASVAARRKTACSARQR